MNPWIFLLPISTLADENTNREEVRSTVHSIFTGIPQEFPIWRPKFRRTHAVVEESEEMQMQKAQLVDTAVDIDSRGFVNKFVPIPGI